MKTSVALALCGALVLAGCGTIRDSRVNPMNWFGEARPIFGEPVDPDRNPLIPERRQSILSDDAPDAPPAPAVDRVTALEVLATPGGALVKARGVAAGPAPHDVELRPDPARSVDGVLAFTLAARIAPGDPGPDAARQVVAAVRVSDEALAGIRSIRVSGAEGGQVARR